MAFQKLFYVIQDGTLGYQTVNQMADNQADFRTQMLVQHGSSDPNAFGRLFKPGGAAVPDYHDLGRHDMVEIPRSVAQTYLFLLNASQVPTIGAGMLWNGSGCPTCWKVDVGQYLLPVVGLSSFWAKASPLVGSSITPLEPQVRPFYASSGNGGNNGLWVSTYQLDAGDFIPADQAFTLALYGKP